MAEHSELKVETDGRFIVITLPGTSFRATYFKASNAGLMQSDYMTDDGSAVISRNEFLDLAFKAANDKARELGWIA